MSAPGVLRIGTRGSGLAMWQATAVAGLLARIDVATEIVAIRTAGDRLQDAPLSDAGGKRLFVKEIEDALLRRDVDLAVHSAKDLPAALPPGLAVAATLSREDPRDALVLPGETRDADFAAARARLSPSSRIGTSSVRRAAQLRPLFPGAVFEPVRGNVDTRLRKLDEGSYDALVLASAGLRRLGLGVRITAAMPIDVCCPAPGQGIIAIEIRDEDAEARAVLERIHDRDAGISFAAERALVAALGGGCQLPLGAVALHEDGGLTLHAVVASPDGSRTIRRSGRGPWREPEALGARVAGELMEAGAGPVLDAVRTSGGPIEGSY